MTPDPTENYPDPFGFVSAHTHLPGRLHYINLFIWPADQAGSTGEVAIQRQGYMIHWIGSGMNYWAISDLNSGELQEFARLMQEGQ